MRFPAANASDAEEFQVQLRVLEKSVRRIVRAHDMRSRALAKASGLTAAQLVVCKGIRELGEVTSAALSAYADISPATVVTILDNLEERGIIQRYRSLSDRRIVHTRLTQTGASLMADAPDALGATLIDRLRHLDPVHRAALVGGVSELAALMELGRPVDSGEPGAQS